MGKIALCEEKKNRALLLKKRKNFVALVLCVLLLCLLSACEEVTNLMEDAPFRENLYDSYTSSYEFYNDDPQFNSAAEPVYISYRIGSVQNFSDKALHSLIAQVASADHPFIGWEYLYNPRDGNSTVPSNFSFNDFNYISSALISPQPAALLAVTGSYYTVKHYKQDPDLSGYSLADTDRLSGATDRPSRAREKSYVGFEADPSWTQLTVTSDGSTTVEIYYDRKMYLLTMDANGGDNAGVTENSIGMRYQSPTAIPTNTFSRDGYTFDGWARSASGGRVFVDGDNYLIGNKNETIYAVWKANEITASVEMEKFGADYELEVEVTTTAGAVIIKWETRDSESFDIDASIPTTAYTRSTADGYTTLTIATADLVPGTYDIYVEAANAGQLPCSRDLKVRIP
ncbi:MAG TPA: hypothetical protein DCQ43_04880 [Treponema sp.]|nr:hypothetical protein [Treponema sp.]